MARVDPGTIAWGVAFVAAFAAAVPLATGDWDPSWLRVAQRPVIDRSPESRLEVPDVQARFTAEGPLGQDGEWRLVGARLESRDRWHHEFEAVHVTLLRPGAGAGSGAPLDRVEATLTATRGRLVLPRDPEEENRGEPHEVPPERAVAVLTLEDGVELAQGDLALVTTTLELRVHRRDRFDPATGGVRLRAPGPVRLRAAGAGLALDAAGLDGVLAPLRVELRGPVLLSSIPRPAGAPASPLGDVVQGRAAGAVLEGLPGPRGRDGAPGEVALTLEQVELDGQGPGDDARALACRALRLSFARVPVAARAALGGLAGVRGTPEVGQGVACYALREVRAEGAVRGRWRGTATGGSSPVGTGAFDLRLDADVVEARLDAGRVRLSGAPARLADMATGHEVRAPRVALRLRGAGEGAPPLERLEALALEGGVVVESADATTHVEAERLTWRRAGRRGRLEVEGAPAVAHVGSAVTADAPWTGRARRLGAWLDPARLADPEGRLEAVEEAVLEGDVDLGRRGDDGPERHAALRGERLAWSRHRARLELTGSPAAVTVGQGTLRSPAVTWDAADGRLDAAGPCALDLPLDGGGAVTVTAARAEARLDPRPGAWRRAGAARRGARRAGARLTLPGWLHALRLEGDGAARVRAAGPDGLQAEADLATWDRAAHRLRLEGRPDLPARLGARGSVLEAPGVDVFPARGPGRARALVLAGPGVRVTGAPAALVGEAESAGASARGGRGDRRGPPASLTLAAEWVAAEVWEPLRPERDARGAGAPPGRTPGVAAVTTDVPLGAFQAGGAGGVTVEGTSPGQGGEPPVPVRLRAARLEGDGGAGTLLLVGEEAGQGPRGVEPRAPVSVERGGLRFEAPRIRVARERDGAAARVRLDGPWTCGLPADRPGKPPGSLRGPGDADLLLDVEQSRALRAEQVDPAAAARALLGLSVRGGLEVDAGGLRARADEAELARPGELLLRGDPVEVVRAGLRSQGLEAVLRVEELFGR